MPTLRNGKGEEDIGLQKREVLETLLKQMMILCVRKKGVERFVKTKQD